MPHDDHEDRHGWEILDELSALAAESDRRMARLVGLVMTSLERELAERLDGLPVST